MTRILVTGAQGLLGSTLVPKLWECGHEVLRHTRKSGGEVSVDLLNTEQISSVLNEVMPEVIVNLAALTNVDECEQNPQLAYRINVRIVENLVMWIQKNDNKCHLVQISTDQVYDHAGPHKEEDVTLSNYYGFSKYAAEISASTVPSTILRTNFFGPSQSVDRVSLSDWLVESLIAEKQTIVFEDIYFSPLSLQRLVELLEHVIVKKQHGVYNLGSKNGMSKADFAFSLAEVLGLSSKTLLRGTSDNLKLTAYRPKNMSMDSSLFESTFGVDLPSLIEEIQSMENAYVHKTR